MATKNANDPPDSDDLRYTCTLISMMKFPPPVGSDVIIMDELRRMVSTRAQLHWLNESLRKRINEWPGLPQLRAFFCTRFQPADKYDPSVDGIHCEIQGFRPVDYEQRAYEIEHKRREALPGADVKLLPGEVSADPEMDSTIKRLAAAKRMPETNVTRAKR